MPESSSQETTPVPRWRWALHLTLLTLYVLWIGASSIGRKAGAEPALTSSVGGLLLASVLGLALFALIFGAALFASRATADDLQLRWRRGFLPLPLGLGYSIALRLLVTIAAIAVAGVLMALGVVDPAEVERHARAGPTNIAAVVSLDAMRDNPTYYWLMMTFVSFVVAGLREELWRAGFLAGLVRLWPNLFASRRGQYFGVVLAAVVFGFGHAAMGPIASVAAGLLGLGLGAILVFHRSIWPAVIAHGCFDAASFALLPLAAKFA
ncbi:MAG TPA: CPBP family intramembrane glutamic endopeptidase [Planctomycetota bacterium]|nr:CPBP family intramembrane glutamic endopeptidase [Planctomycetota bacterium]